MAHHQGSGPATGYTPEQIRMYQQQMHYNQVMYQQYVNYQYQVGQGMAAGVGTQGVVGGQTGPAGLGQHGQPRVNAGYQQQQYQQNMEYPRYGQDRERGDRGADRGGYRGRGRGRGDGRRDDRGERDGR